MGVLSWDLDGGFSSPLRVRTPRLTIRCEYPDTDLPHTEVTFRLAPSYGLTTGHEANEWFLEMMHKYEEFEGSQPPPKTTAWRTLFPPQAVPRIRLSPHGSASAARPSAS